VRFKQTANEFGDSLADANLGDESAPLYQSSVVGNVMQQSSQVQAKALLGEDFEEDPLFADGLVPSADGMHWERPAS
jgi:halogenation protein CepH